MSPQDCTAENMEYVTGPEQQWNQEQTRYMNTRDRLGEALQVPDGFMQYRGQEPEVIVLILRQ